MTSASTLLENLRARGVVVRVEGCNLKLKPVAAIDAVTLACLREHKLQLLRLLASTNPHTALVQFCEAVESHRYLNAPGLVRMSRELVTLWRAAEAEVGHGVALSGQPRPERPRVDVPASWPSCYPHDLYLSEATIKRAKRPTKLQGGDC